MLYTLSVDSFNNTFSVKADGSRLTHHSGIKFQLFPFIANNNSDPVVDLSSLIGLYLGEIEGKKPIQISVEELIAKLKNDEDLNIDLGADEIFNQVVRHMFFDKDGKIRPINLKMISQIPCSETNEGKLADYLVIMKPAVRTGRWEGAGRHEMQSFHTREIEGFTGGASFDFRGIGSRRRYLQIRPGQL